MRPETFIMASFTMMYELWGYKMHKIANNAVAE